VRQIRAEVAQARESASESLRLAAEGGHGYQAAVASVIRGWAAGMESQGVDGVDEIISGINAHAETGAVMDRPHYLGLLGEVHLTGNRPDEAESVLREAMASIDGDRPFFYEAELRRLLAWALRAQGETEEAERTLRSALDAARRQAALGMELRIASDRLAIEEGSADARRDVQAVLSRISEGHDTPDFLRAQELVARAG
jgi:tetratricopeptide (TPR) repeat protein